MMLCLTIVPYPSMVRNFPSAISAFSALLNSLYSTKSFLLGVICSVLPLSRNHSTFLPVLYQEKLMDLLLVIDNSGSPLISIHWHSLVPFLSPFLFLCPCTIFSFCPLRNLTPFGKKVFPCPYLDFFLPASDFVCCGLFYHILCTFGPSS